MGQLPTTELNRKVADQGAVLKDCEEAEAAIAELRNAYEQYFLGIERKPPHLRHAEVKKLVLKVKASFVRSTAVKFRLQALHNKFLSYERLWARTMMEIEAGTYRRDLFKAKLRHKDEPVKRVAKEAVPEERAPAGFEQVPQVTPPPVRPLAAAPPGNGAPKDVSEEKMRAVYNAYVTAKKRCNEDVSKLSYEAVASSLRKQVPELMKKHNAKAVEFKVVIKDGKAVLRAVPK